MSSGHDDNTSCTSRLPKLHAALDTMQHVILVLETQPMVLALYRVQDTWLHATGYTP